MSLKSSKDDDVHSYKLEETVIHWNSNLVAKVPKDEVQNKFLL